MIDEMIASLRAKQQALQDSEASSSYFTSPSTPLETELAPWYFLCMFSLFMYYFWCILDISHLLYTYDANIFVGLLDSLPCAL